MRARTTGYILGLLGLLPFSFGAWLSWQLEAHQGVALKMMLIYAALIITFIGALHWGRVMARETAQGQARSVWLIWSIIPCMAAFSLLYMSAQVALIAAILVLFTCLGVDLLAYRKGGMPPWMMRLRLLLTSGASACLLIAWAATLENPYFQPEYIGYSL